jgi:hypothetical protein
MMESSSKIDWKWRRHKVVAPPIGTESIAAF